MPELEINSRSCSGYVINLPVSWVSWIPEGKVEKEGKRERSTVNSHCLCLFCLVNNGPIPTSDLTINRLSWILSSGLARSHQNLYRNILGKIRYSGFGENEAREWGLSDKAR